MFGQVWCEQCYQLFDFIMLKTKKNNTSYNGNIMPCVTVVSRFEALFWSYCGTVVCAPTNASSHLQNYTFVFYRYSTHQTWACRYATVVQDIQLTMAWEFTREKRDAHQRDWGSLSVISSCLHPHLPTSDLQSKSLFWILTSLSHLVSIVRPNLVSCFTSSYSVIN